MLKIEIKVRHSESVGGLKSKLSLCLLHTLPSLSSSRPNFGEAGGRGGDIRVYKKFDDLIRI